MMEVTEAIKSDSQTALIDLAVESWRMSRLFLRLLTKLEAAEGARYSNQLRYFLRKVETSLNAADCRLVNLEGQPFDAGFPATALNVGEFGPDDQLLVDQMLEPVIMGRDGVVRMGTVLLKRVQ